MSKKTLYAGRNLAISAAIILTLQSWWSANNEHDSLWKKNSKKNNKENTTYNITGTHNDSDVVAHTNSIPFSYTLDEFIEPLQQTTTDSLEEILEQNTIRSVALNTKSLMNSVEHIVLHSTEHLKNQLENNVVIYLQKVGKIHFIVKRDWNVVQYLPSSTNNLVQIDHIWKEANPNSNATRNEDPNITYKSIWIEVSAHPWQEWSQEQYEAIKKLVQYLGAKYNLQKKDVLTHTMVAYSKQFGMMRKHDPAYINREKLDLPPSSAQINTSVVTGVIAPNLTALYKWCRKQPIWSNPGLWLSHQDAIIYLENHYAWVNDAIMIHKNRFWGINPKANHWTNKEARLTIDEINSKFVTYTPPPQLVYKKKRTLHKARRR